MASVHSACGVFFRSPSVFAVLLPYFPLLRLEMATKAWKIQNVVHRDDFPNGLFVTEGVSNTMGFHWTDKPVPIY